MDVGTPAKTPDFTSEEDAQASPPSPPPELEAAPSAPDSPEAAYDNVWEAAIGAAMGGAGGPFSVDFRRAERDWQSVLRGVVTHLMFSSCLALLVLLGWAFYYHQGAARNRQEAQAIQEQIDALNEEIQAMAEQGLGEEVDVTPFKDPSLLDLMREFSRIMPGDKVKITRIRVMPREARGPWIRIEGTVDDAALFTEVYEKLKQSEIMRVDEQPDLRQQGELITFSVRAFRPEEESDEVET